MTISKLVAPVRPAEPSFLWRQSDGAGQFSRPTGVRRIPPQAVISLGPEGSLFNGVVPIGASYLAVPAGPDAAPSNDISPLAITEIDVATGSVGRPSEGVSPTNTSESVILMGSAEISSRADVLMKTSQVAIPMEGALPTSPRRRDIHAVRNPFRRRLEGPPPVAPSR